jgi:hypothetical protein
MILEYKLFKWLFWKIVWWHGKWPFEYGWISTRYCCPIDYICTKLHNHLEKLEVKFKDRAGPIV